MRRHKANFDFILGKWGQDEIDSERRSVSLEYRLLKTGPAVMVIDAAGRQFTSSPVAGVPLARAEVIGTSLAGLVFALVDTIVMDDLRLKDLTRSTRRQ